MLRPSYTELMNLLNEDDDLDNKITSRYTIVMAVAKRARQIIAGSEEMVICHSDKAVSNAVAEMAAGKLKITAMNQNDENTNTTIIESENANLLEFE